MNSLIKILFSSLILRVLSALSSFLMTYIIAQKLSISDAGLFFIGLSIVAISNTLSFQGLENIVIKKTSENCSDGFLIWGGYKVFINSIIICLVMCLIIYISKVLEFNFHVPLYFILSITPFTLLYYFSFFFQGGGYLILSNLSQTILLNVMFISFILISDRMDINEASKIYFFCSIFSCVISFILITVKVSFHNLKFNLSNIDFSFLSESRSLFVIGIALLINQWFGQLFISLFLDVKDAAIFSVAQRISLLLTFILLAINFVVSSRYSVLIKNKKVKEIRYLNNKVFVFSISLSVPIFAFIVIFSDNILSYFGDGYEYGYLILIILCFGQLVNVITGPVNYILIMSGNSSKLKVFTIVSSLFTLFLLYPLIYFLGGVGAAIVICLSVIILNSLSVVEARKVLKGIVA